MLLDSLHAVMHYYCNYLPCELRSPQWSRKGYLLRW